MNKKALKTYLNGAMKSKIYKHPELRDNCFKYGNYYLISDTNSLIRLDKNYDLPIKEHEQLSKMFDNFDNNYAIEFTFMHLEEEGDNPPIDENFCINRELFNKINAVIKGNTFAIVRKQFDDTPVIRLENTKTKALAYMLPMKRY